MAITLAEIFEQTKERYELKLVAGEDGLQQEMNWVYVAEDQANASFLRPGELIISTGALYDHSEQWILSFLKTLVAHHTCGLILNVGKHLFPSDLTDRILAYCNEHNFPLFLMPWHIHIYDITKDYYDRIFADIHAQQSPDFFKLLTEIKNTSLLEHYVEQKLGNVLEHDRKKGSNLSETLYLYLKHWGNIQKIASENYCHRNTITNRIHFLEEKLGYSLEDPRERFELMSAFLVKEFLTSSDG